MRLWIAFTSILISGLTFGEQSRPNILWLSTEDISPHLGCYGDPDAITPNLDALAARGIRYSRAFTVAPVCAPNRSSIITGMYPQTIGTHHMRSGGEGVERSIKPKLPPEIKPFPEYMREAGYYCTNNSKKDYNFESDYIFWNESSKNAHWKNRPDDAPFFAVFNYGDTHEGSIRSNPKQFAEKTKRLTEEQRRDPAKLTIPAYHPDTPVVREQWKNIHELVTGLDYWVADHLKALEEAGLAENTIIVFWSDHGTGLPRHKRWVYDSGVHVPLIVYVPEKWQKVYDVKPGTVVDDLVSSIDLAPSTLNLAGLEVPKHMQGQAFLGTNLPEPRTYVFGGRDRMDERYDMIRYIRSDRYKMIFNYMPFKPYVQYTNTAQKSPVHQEYQRLIDAGELPKGSEWVTRKTKPVIEFYDLETDPLELTNLAKGGDFEGGGDQKVSFRDMKYAGVHWIWEESRDLAFIPEAELNRLEKEHGYRYAIPGAHAPEDLNLFSLSMTVAIMEQAQFDQDLKGNEDDAMAKLEAALAAESTTIRYWAALGLGRIDDGADRLARVMEEDESVVVRLAAAQSVVVVHQTEALRVLESGLRDPDEWVRLQAATALDEIGELARPVIPAMKKALNDKHNKYVVRVVNRALNVLEGTNNQVR